MQFGKYILSVFVAIFLSACGDADRPSDRFIESTLVPHLQDDFNGLLAFVDMSAPKDFFIIKDLEVINGVPGERSYKAFVKAKIVHGSSLADVPANKRRQYASIYGEFKKGELYDELERQFTFIKGDKGWMLQ
jgi:hypothetical protein